MEREKHRQDPPIIRTDLAVEAREMYVKEQEQSGRAQQGVTIEENQVLGYGVTYVKIDEIGEKEIGKKAGNYITIQSEAVKQQDSQSQEETAKVLGQELQTLLQLNQLSPNASCLIVGLGNDKVTPDALGPLALSKLLVTRHLFAYHPETVENGYRSVSAFSPGVMGVTGVETSDIISGVVEKVQPDFVIVIDALASRSVERVNATIQLSDTGIHPGSGVGNKRKELSEVTLGVPVIAIGVPTVVDAVTITSDTIDYVFKHFGREWKEKDKPSKRLAPSSLNFGKRELTEDDLPQEEQRKAIFGMIGELGEDEKRALIHEVLSPLGHNLMVTPKEVDGYMKDMAHLIASGLNIGLHEKVNPNDPTTFTR